MERQTMYCLLQACLTGQIDYMTAEGVTFYHAPDTHHRQHALVLDLLMDRYLLEPGQPIELSVNDVTDLVGLPAHEIVRSVVSLAKITLVSHHIEEKLLRIISANIEEEGRLTLVIGFNAWLRHHLTKSSEPSYARKRHPVKGI